MKEDKRKLDEAISVVTLIIPSTEENKKAMWQVLSYVRSCSGCWCNLSVGETFCLVDIIAANCIQYPLDYATSRLVVSQVVQRK